MTKKKDYDFTDKQKDIILYTLEEVIADRFGNKWSDEVYCDGGFTYQQVAEIVDEMRRTNQINKGEDKYHSCELLEPRYCSNNEFVFPSNFLKGMLRKDGWKFND